MHKSDKVFIWVLIGIGLVFFISLESQEVSPDMRATAWMQELCKSGFNEYCKFDTKVNTLNSLDNDKIENDNRTVTDKQVIVEGKNITLNLRSELKNRLNTIYTSEFTDSQELVYREPDDETLLNLENLMFEHVARVLLILENPNYYKVVPQVLSHLERVEKWHEYAKKLGITENTVKEFTKANIEKINKELSKNYNQYTSTWNIMHLVNLHTSLLTEKCLIKWNISKNGERIYHTKEAPYYADATIETQKWEKWFCTEEEAQRAWWKKEKSTEYYWNNLTPDEERQLEEEYELIMQENDGFIQEDIPNEAYDDTDYSDIEF